jgi:hypothetical protein
MRRLVGCVVAALALGPGGAGAEPPRAERITEGNAASLLIGGPDAIGGVGDWYLANDAIEVVVDDPGRRHAKLNHGGTIVDVGIPGRDGEDQFARLFPIVNLDQRVQVGYDAIRAEVDPGGGWARLVVTASGGMSSVQRGGRLARWLDPLVPDTRKISAVITSTSYEVRAGEPFVRIVTELRNQGEEAAPVFAFGDVWMRGGRSMRVFVGNTLRPESSRGFRHRGFDRHAILSAGEAVAPFTFAAMSGVVGFPPISYAIVAPERAARGLPCFGVTGKHVTLVIGFVSDPDWPALNLMRLLRATRGRLEPGERWRFERRLLVAPGDDVAAVTDLAFPMLGFTDGTTGVRGRVEPAGVRSVVHLERAGDGSPVTQATTAAEGPERGRFSALLPPGDYVLRLRAEGRPDLSERFRVEPGSFAEVPPQQLAETGRLRLAPAFADGAAGRLIVTGLGDTPDPVFGAELLGFELDGAASASGTETNALLFAGGAGDPERVFLAPGRYRLTATRGPEFELVQRDVVVRAGAELEVLPFALERVSPLPGFVSADLHVHAQASDDSGMPNDVRLRSFLAEWVDVIVSTDHDRIGDFEPALEALGAGDRIRVRRGVEVTSSAPSAAAPWTIGHHNAWPMAYRPHAHRRGAPPSQGLTLAELYASLRRDGGARVLQLNHPLERERGLQEGAFLSHLGSAGEPFDPERPMDASPNRLLLETASDGRTRAIDFDVIELMNGDSFDQYLRVRDIWYSLLRQGFRRAASGNSDSHGPDQTAGYPRNYVRAKAGASDAAGFDAAVREGRFFATTGPLIADFRANGGGMGDTVSASEGRVELQLAVSAAPWVPVDEVRLLVNGEVVRSFRDLLPPERVMRLLHKLTLRLERDAFLTLEAGAPLDADPARWAAERGGAYAAQVAPGFVSQAVANPIFVDVDGNGRFDAPGFPAVSGSGRGSARLQVTAALVLLLALVWWRLRARTRLSDGAMAALLGWTGGARPRPGR